MYDLLGVGVVTIDTLLQVDAYPPEDSKAAVRARRVRLGGLTGAALVAAARFGARCAYAGLLGDNLAARQMRHLMEAEGIDLAHAPHQADAAPVESFIIVSAQNQSRTIFHDSNRPCGAHPRLPDESLLRQTRVFFADHHSAEGMLRAARAARAAGVPVVADIERFTSPLVEDLLALADHLIVSHGFAARITGERDPEAMLAGLWRPGRSLVAVTRGADGAWWTDGSGVHHQPAFPVQAVDTTGCGDVFHGVYAALLARGAAPAERIRTAAAAAAVKASQWEIPTREQVERLV